MTSEGVFLDTSTDCAICLEPLIEDSDEEAVLTLSCGHKWHKNCLVQQLHTAQPSPSQRLLFYGCQCAKCGKFCDHPDLQDLTRTTDSLRTKVDKLLEEQLAADPRFKQAMSKKETNAAHIAQLRQQWMDRARRQYAFYLCGHCKEPYFGGTVDCADQLQLAPDNVVHSSEERLCVACAPPSQAACQNPLEHRGHLIWKCRYCCKPSAFVCYGSVHFCQECHDRNSRRVHHQQQQGQSSTKPPALEPIPCPGETCAYPKSNTSTPFHSNGHTMASEQVYGCAMCSSRQIHHPTNNENDSGSRNLLVNPNGQMGLQGWTTVSGRMAWKVETSEIPLDSDTTTNFVSSFRPCVMTQTVDLSSCCDLGALSRSQDVSLEVSARYMARTDCPSVFALRVVLSNAQRQVIHEKATQLLLAPPDFWDCARLDVDAATLNNVRFVTVVVMGKDSRFWQGLFGSKVTHLSLRLMAPHAALEGLSLSDAYRNNAATEQPQVIPREQLDEAKMKVWREGVFPILIVLMLWWIFQR